jgi:uncharacterized protein
MSTHAHPTARAPGVRLRAALRRTGAFLRTEQGVVTAALAVIALHIADDNFVQRELGTTPGDHLASGLIPLAVLGLAAWAYPHLRAGARAAIVMPLGAIGIATGIPGAYYLSHGAAGGDDWSGLLAIAAGAVLVVSGPVTLWRNRSRDASRKHRYVHRGVTGLTIAITAPVLFAVLVFPVGFAYVYTHSGRIAEDPKLGVPYEMVRFPSGSIDLTGYYVPSRNGANVVVYPGPPRSHEARMLVRHGYGVLLVDPRGQGRSEGDVDRWAGDDDLVAAAEYLQQRPGVDPGKIAGFGFSIGGEQLLEAAAKSKAYAAVVSEGAGSQVGGDEDVTSSTGKILAKPTLTVMTAAMMLFQNEHRPARTVDVIGRIAPRPVFLIYADPGMGGELQLQPKFYAAAGRPKQIWQAGAKHTGGIDSRPREYELRVTSFLDQALLER